MRTTVVAAYVVMGALLVPKRLVRLYRLLGNLPETELPD